MKRINFIYIFFDLFILVFAFLAIIMIKTKGEYNISYIKQYLLPFMVFVSMWILISLGNQKFLLAKKYSLNKAILLLFQHNLLITGILFATMYATRTLSYSRMIVFGTIGMSTFLESILLTTHYYLRTAKIPLNTPILNNNRIEETQEENPETIPPLSDEDSYSLLKALFEETSPDVFRFIISNLNFNHSDFSILSTTTSFNVSKLPYRHYQKIINIKRINDIRFVNKFFEAVNCKLKYNGHFIGCVETKELRKKRLLKKYPPVLNYIYYFFDFIVKRIFPKFNLTKHLYFFLTRGQNRVISRAEVLGRLYSCGFKLIAEKDINGLHYFIGEKKKEPVYDPDPSYGPLIKLKRIGKEGKEIKVYKIRTMHPFAEYLQEFVYQQNYLQEGGKFNNDFRVTSVGRLLRKFWVDEVPMVINLLKGELKIVGVRPLSYHYYNLYDKELQEKRIKVKPGLIPPFYADMPSNLEEIQESEKRYLKQYLENPLRTDIKYFFKASRNILIRNKRSS